METDNPKLSDAWDCLSLYFSQTGCNDLSLNLACVASRSQDVYILYVYFRQILRESPNIDAASILSQIRGCQTNADSLKRDSYNTQLSTYDRPYSNVASKSLIASLKYRMSAGRQSPVAGRRTPRHAAGSVPCHLRSLVIGPKWLVACYSLSCRTDFFGLANELSMSELSGWKAVELYLALRFIRVLHAAVLRAVPGRSQRIASPCAAARPLASVS